MFKIEYRHDDCEVQPGVTWSDTWSCACNSECPACGIKDIEPVDWEEVESSYRVTWTIDIDALNPQDAARKAREAQTRPDTIATVFEVTDENGDSETVDLSELDETEEG